MRCSMQFHCGLKVCKATATTHSSLFDPQLDYVLFIFAHNSKRSHSLRSHVGAGHSAAGFVWFKVIPLDPSLPPFPSQLSTLSHPHPTAFHPVSSSCSRSSLNAKLDETVPLKCDEPYITPSMVSLSAPVVTSSDGHSAAAAAAAAAYSQSNIVRVSAL